MPDAIWIDREGPLRALAAELASQPTLGVDTEFLRERTFFPRLCLLQLAAAGRIWCVDALAVDLEALVPVLTAARPVKIIHAARQDLEAFYLTCKRIISPLFDTQIAAACLGGKPQIGYADLVRLELGVHLQKGQTRTDWSKRPLSAAQLEYAADDVLHLEAIAARLRERLRALGREDWVLEDCLALQDPELYDPAPAQAAQRLKGLQSLEPRPRARAKALAVWRETLARSRDLPRSWILSDAALFDIARSNAATAAALRALPDVPKSLNETFAASLLEALRADALIDPGDQEPSREQRPTPEQKLDIERLNKIVDATAAELGVSAEVLAPRGEIKSLVQGRRDSPALAGWRRAAIGDALLAALA
jgi:ribonuclease D